MNLSKCELQSLWSAFGYAEQKTQKRSVIIKSTTIIIAKAQGRQELWDFRKSETTRVHKCMAVAVVKFIIFPICLMHTYAHCASAWQLIWQRNQAKNMMSCRLTTPGINIYVKARRPRRVIITLCRPKCSILKSYVFFLLIIALALAAAGIIFNVQTQNRTNWRKRGEKNTVCMVWKQKQRLRKGSVQSKASGDMVGVRRVSMDDNEEWVHGVGLRDRAGCRKQLTHSAGESLCPAR